MKKAVLFLAILFVYMTKAYSQYYCTAASSNFYPHLLNLIGSIHATNFELLKEIAVFDLGLQKEQIDHLQTIKKVKVYRLKENNPALFTFYTLPNGHRILGWYMWKPVVIKEALEMFPHVLWIDAGTTVLKPLDDLFNYIEQEGYFLSTIGDDEQLLHNVKWQTTSFLVEKFRLNAPENVWIQSKESIMGGIVGVAQWNYGSFVREWYDLTHDIRFFEDNGTTPNGFGTGRHDQAVLSILGYLRGLKVHEQNYKQLKPIILSLDNGDVPFHITWNGDYVDYRTCIYSSRGDIKDLHYYKSKIKYLGK